MENNLLDLLVRLVLASSAAIVLTLLLRRPLRHLAGAAAAYGCWLLVPVVLLAAALPAVRSAPALVRAMAPALQAPTLAAVSVPAGSAGAGWVLLAWAGGALASAALLLAGQRAFVRSLGNLRERDGIFLAANERHGPALLGLWRPRIVVPSDFEVRYSAAEQALIIAHEQLHAERRDPAANAALALLQCAFWFNPLMHIAASRFRFDQELACDAAVMARHGGQRQAYAAAMLKTRVAGAPALATCHWQSSHPLKERIMQLKQTIPGAARRRAGHLVVALLACTSMLGTVAARAGTAPAGGGDYLLSVQFVPGADNAAPAVPVKAGADTTLFSKQPGAGWSGTFRVIPAEDGMVYVKMKITQENGAQTAPTLLMRLGEKAGVESNGKPGEPAFKIGIMVTRPAPGA